MENSNKLLDCMNDWEIITEEIWKDIPGYEGYQASSLGRIRSNRSPVKRKGLKWKVLKLHFSGRSPRLTVGLMKNRTRKSVLVHKAVLMAFVSPCPNGMECCRNNGNPLDNRIENLRWDTPRANNRDVAKRGKRKGENSGTSKLTNKQVLEIRKKYKEDETTTYSGLAREYKVSTSTLRAIITRHTWRHI